MRGEYRFRFYLNARHRIKIDNIESKTHPHTWEIVLHVLKRSQAFIQFSEIEQDINKFLSRYESRCLNEVPPFDMLMPTMENLGEVIAAQCVGLLSRMGWQLGMLEISENPSRSYIVTDLEAPLGDSSSICTIDIYDNIIDDNIRDSSQISIPDDPGDSSSIHNINENRSGDSHHNVNFEELSPLLKTAKPYPLLKTAKPSLNILVSLVTVAVAALLLHFWVTREGSWPWGSDSWYHLFKGHLLYNSMRSGNFYPLYTDIWYNGLQPLRYWAPLPHYVLAGFEFLSGGNPAQAYNLFIITIFLTGAIGWILWGTRLKRPWTALALSLLWFFLPDNLRVLFSEGNLSRVAVTAVFPFLLLSVWTFYEKKTVKSLAATALLMMVITLCHAMIAAMVGVTLAVLILFYAVAAKEFKPGIYILAAVAAGIALAGVWLVPALKGGLLSMDQGAVQELMKGLTFPAAVSLNPLLRLSDRNVFYFGGAIFAAAVFGLIFAGRKSRAAFAVTLAIFAGTTKLLLPVLVKIPMSQVFWMMRFTPLALGLFFMGLLLWKGLRRELLALILVLVMLDSYISFSVLCFDRPEPEGSIKALQPALQYTSGRTALLDESSLGSFPGFYLAYGGSKSIRQIFGSGWQGASTAENLVWINTALEKGWYAYVFDRCLQMGADTVVLRRDVPGDYGKALSEAEKAGYRVIGESGLAVTLKYPVDYDFGTIAQYQGMAIGRYASNISIMFPCFETGDSEYVDDYAIDRLEGYKVVFLSGFRYRDRGKAENLIKALSEKGTRVVIDLTNADEDLYTSRAGFLGVGAEPVSFTQKLPDIEIQNGRLAFSGRLPDRYPEWRTVYLENLDGMMSKTYFNNQEMDVSGTKVNPNIVFLGLNIPFYTLETMDPAGISLLAQVTGLNLQNLRSVPKREIVKLDETVKGNRIIVKSDKNGAVAGIAALDAFRTVSGGYTVEENMVRLDGRNLELEVTYPDLLPGIAVSVAGILSLILLLYLAGHPGCLTLLHKRFNRSEKGGVI